MRVESSERAVLLCHSNVTTPVQVLYCTVLYCTVLYCTVLYCTMLALQRNMKPLFIVWNDPKQLDLGQIFSCSDNSTLTLATEPDTAHSKQCSDGKHLYPNGRKYYGTTEKIFLLLCRHAV